MEKWKEKRLREEQKLQAKQEKWNRKRQRRRERFMLFNQYGYRMDAFDKYRDAMASGNRRSLRVLGIAGACLAAVVLIYEAFVLRKPAGFAAGIGLAAASFGAVKTGFREDSGRKQALKTGFREQGDGFFSSPHGEHKRTVPAVPAAADRKQVLKAGYRLYAAYYLIGIYGSVAQNNWAFWVGVLMGLSGFMLDYAWRLMAMQILSWMGLILAWAVTGGGLGTERILFTAVFLLAGMVAQWSQGRSRIDMITSREESRQQADTDLLTGLTIRNAAQMEIERHLSETGECGVMMLLDLDRFKSVNDRLGHQEGDRVLIDVAADLKKMFRSSDVLSRLGGDEYIIYMKNVPEKEWVEQRAEQVVRAVRRWVGGEIHIQVTASVGVVTTEMVERDYNELYRAADIAMYFAKAAGGNRAVFWAKDLADRARPAAPVREEEDLR